MIHQTTFEAAPGFEPGRLWSLWEMLEFKAGAFYVAISILKTVQATIEMGAKYGAPDATDALPDNIKANGLRDLKTLLAELIVLDAKMAALSTGRLIERMEKTGASITLPTFAEGIKDIDYRLRDELSFISVFVLPADKAKLYKSREPLFGSEFAAKFPSAQYDIDEAGKCLALGRSTASVFHLMRAMEAGLASLAAELGVSAEENWNKTLNQFDAALKKLQEALKQNSAAKPTDWKDKESFYSEASALLRNVKNACRNDVSHIGKKYTEEEAQRILSATQDWLRFLSSRLSEVPSSAA